MKVLYSQIKELVPDLKAEAKEVGEILTLTGFMMDNFEEVSYKGKKDYLISLEIRQNRPDCLSVIGIAREVAAYYNLKLSLSSLKSFKVGDEKLDIKVEAKDFVKRIKAIRIDNLENKESPQWLKEYMSFYGLASVGILVDLSNYVMMLTGYPSHLIDCNKIEGDLFWSINNNFKEVTTLSGLLVNLKKDEIIIRDKNNLLALAGIVGSKSGLIEMNTKSIIAEIAIYNSSLIRKNSRSLSIITEASRRLEKDVDPNGVDYALDLLISLILEYAGGEVSSSFDYYPKKYVSPKIEFDKKLASKLSGIDISNEDVFKILKSLDFEIEDKGDVLLVTPPTGRNDVNLPEDVAEEVIRIYGYNHIPTDEIPQLEVVQNITPSNIILSEKIRDILSILGFDEVLSWPLTQKGINDNFNYSDLKEIFTQNSVNDLYPNLRQSMAPGLMNQMNEYYKKGVEYIDIFEIGKIFGEKDNKYIEQENLGVLSVNKNEIFPQFKNNIESLLRLIGFNDVKYFDSKLKPNLANPKSCFDIFVNNQPIGIIYKLIPSDIKLNLYITEINIKKITEMLLKIENNPVVEITKKLIALDVNIEINKEESIYKFIDLIPRDNVWSINITDAYQGKEKIKYTLRITYKELSDEEAKKEHLKISDLIKKES